VRSCSSIVLMALIAVALSSAQPASQNAPEQDGFDDRAGSRLLLQLSEALQGHSDKRFLAAFDLSKMNDGALFRQQIDSFFSQTEIIRVHMNLAETGVEGQRATVAVDAEMEAEPRNGGPTVRKTERLNFVVVKAGGWKFIEMQPRSFFALP
jgi:hypothetical protein